MKTFVRAWARWALPDPAPHSHIPLSVMLRQADSKVSGSSAAQQLSSVPRVQQDPALGLWCGGITDSAPPGAGDSPGHKTHHCLLTGRRTSLQDKVLLGLGDMMRVRCDSQRDCKHLCVLLRVPGCYIPAAQCWQLEPLQRGSNHHEWPEGRQIKIFSSPWYIPQRNLYWKTKWEIPSLFLLLCCRGECGTDPWWVSLASCSGGFGERENVQL